MDSFYVCRSFANVPDVHTDHLNTIIDHPMVEKLWGIRMGKWFYVLIPRPLTSH